jgi:hypothetical protein
MSGETNLKTLLSNLSPILLQDTFVFCTFPKGSYGDFAQTCPKAFVMEKEGVTLVMEKAVADSQGFNYSGEFSCISLEVHSSLEAIGLTAVISGMLAAHEISVNMMAGYHHDHLFVPVANASAAMALLHNLDHLEKTDD